LSQLKIKILADLSAKPVRLRRKNAPFLASQEIKKPHRLWRKKKAPKSSPLALMKSQSDLKKSEFKSQLTKQNAPKMPRRRRVSATAEQPEKNLSKKRQKNRKISPKVR